MTLDHKESQSAVRTLRVEVGFSSTLRELLEPEKWVAQLRKSFEEDWTLLPYMTIAVAGFVASILDFVFLQNVVFQVFAIAGLVAFALGGYLRNKARLELRKKAGFNSLAATGRLRIVEGHQLVKDGLYKHVRHPLYLGEILRNFSFPLIFSSIYGALLMFLGMVLLLFRIEIEEKMLIEAFGEEYREYQKNTKKLIPRVY
jgi:protein-S-isoprenylcysteine O-methyltransferase Ste14